MIKRLSVLKRQNSKWDIIKEHSFNLRHYAIDEKGNFYHNNKLRIINPSANGDKSVFLIDDNNKHVRFKIHQVLMQTFFPNELKCGETVDHINRVRTDNRIENLRFATRKMQYDNRENKIHKYKKVRCLNNNVIYNSCQDAEDSLGIIRNNVSRVARGERKSIHGYKFEYID